MRTSRILFCMVFATLLPTMVQAKGNPLRGLSNLNPYDNVAVLQRKFLPKTERWEFYGSGSVLLNDPFFLNVGLMARLGYSWKEQHALEVTAFDISPSKRKVVDDLLGQGIETNTLISPEGFFGASYRWSPIYGKMSPYGEGILPFDMYFSFGGGVTLTNKGGAEPTFHLGSGQIFAIDKDTAFRWDFSWLFFNAVAENQNKFGEVISRSSSTFSTLYINIGLSFFFPEAGYR